MAIVAREGDRLAVESGTRVQSRGDAPAALHVVESGWLYLEADSADGRRHLVRTHHAGDLVGLPELACREAAADLVALTGAVLYRLDRRAFARIATRDRRTSAWLLVIGARDQLLQADLRRATTLSARHRVLFLLLTLLHRMRASGEVDGDGFELPLNQARSGDLLGLTNVSVSRAMVELERDGTIERRHRHVTLLDAVRSASQVGFVDRFAELDTSWFPDGATDPDSRLVA